MPYNPITTFSLGPIQINIWGLLVALGFAAGITLALSRARQKNIDSKHIWNIVLIAVICGVAGSRLLYVLENAAYFLQHPIESFNLSTGGLSFFGGFLLSLFGVWVYARKSKGIEKSPLEILDLFILPLLISMVFGRIGCFLAHDHLGRAMAHPYFWGIEMNGKFYHDPALYLLLTNSALFLIFLHLRDRMKQAGKQTFIFLIVLSFSRLGWDYFRNDARYWGLTAAQHISLIIVLICIFLAKSRIPK